MRLLTPVVILAVLEAVHQSIIIDMKSKCARKKIMQIRLIIGNAEQKYRFVASFFSEFYNVLTRHIPLMLC